MKINKCLQNLPKNFTQVIVHIFQKRSLFTQHTTHILSSNIALQSQNAGILQRKCCLLTGLQKYTGLQHINLSLQSLKSVTSKNIQSSLQCSPSRSIVWQPFRSIGGKAWMYSTIRSPPVVSSQHTCSPKHERATL